MRLLIFGSSGQLGQQLAEICSSAGIDAISLRRDSGDIADPKQVAIVIARVQPTIIVNAAAYTKVDRAESEPEAAYRENSLGPGILARACNLFGVPLIHVSTDYVFDGEKVSPYVESDSVSPLGVYGASKEAGERAIRAELEQHLIIRTAWVYGLFGQNFLQTMLKLAQSKDDWGVVADQLGNPTSTHDLSHAILESARRVQTGEPRWGTYHFAGQGDASWHDFAKEIVDVQARITGRFPVVRPIKTSEFPTAARRPMNSRLDSSLFASTFDFRARPWQERVEEVVSMTLKRKRG